MDEPRWFQRHRCHPLARLPNYTAPSLRERVEKRRQIIQHTANIALTQKPNSKRRGHKPEYEAEEKAGLEPWLTDAVESVAEKLGGPFTIEQQCAYAEDNPRVLSVAQATVKQNYFCRRLDRNSHVVERGASHDGHRSTLGAYACEARHYSETGSRHQDYTEELSLLP